MKSENLKAAPKDTGGTGDVKKKPSQERLMCQRVMKLFAARSKPESLCLHICALIMLFTALNLTQRQLEIGRLRHGLTKRDGSQKRSRRSEMSLAPDNLAARVC